MNIVIPMAGLGSRFANAGYQMPKPFIDVLGIPMIEHVLQNFATIPNAQFILIARREHIERYPDIVRSIQKQYNVEFILIDRVTEGAACTVLYAHRLINNDTPLLIANSDQILDIDTNLFVEDCLRRMLDGSMLTFYANHNKWSYAALNDRGFVTHVREKEVISNHATVGVYMFTHGKTFVESALDMIIHNERVNNEFYVCPVYNYSIGNGSKVGIFEIKESEMHGTGTPEDLNAYIKLKQLT